MDSKTLHYRPKDYWPADASINVQFSNLKGIKINDKLWGGDVQAAAADHR